MLKSIKRFIGIYDAREKALISLLKDIELFKIFNNRQLVRFTDKFKLTDYPLNKHLIKKGEKPTFIGLLESGQIDVYVEENEKRITVGEIKPGQMFFEMSFVSNTVASANLISNKDCIIWQISFENFKELLTEYPQLQQELIKTIKDRQNMTKEAKNPTPKEEIEGEEKIHKPTIKQPEIQEEKSEKKFEEQEQEMVINFPKS